MAKLRCWVFGKDIFDTLEFFNLIYSYIIKYLIFIFHIVSILRATGTQDYLHWRLQSTGDFAFTAAEGGDYMACFWVPDHKPKATVAIDFNWKTRIAAKDWSKVVRKGQIELTELELKKLCDTVTSIHDEMFYLRMRLRTEEEEMQQLNRATNSKMATLGFLSIMVCLSVAGLQLWHLQTFFERKKLL